MAAFCIVLFATGGSKNDGSDVNKSGDDQDVDPVAEQQQPEQHLRQRSFEQEVDAAGGQQARDGEQSQACGHFSVP